MNTGLCIQIALSHLELTVIFWNVFCIKVPCVHFAFRKYSEWWGIYEISLGVFPITKLDFFYIDFSTVVSL